MMRPRTRLSVLATSVVVVLLLCAGLALAFTDVGSNYGYYQAIEELSNLDIINGFQDGSFRPNDLVKRQQFAKMIVLTLGLPVSENDVCPFGDVDKSAPGTLYPDHYVAVAAARGITKGVNSWEFKPFNDITRAQVITMVVRAAPLAGINLTQPTSAYYGDPRYAMRNFDDPTHGINAHVAEVNGLLYGIMLDSGGTWDPWKKATRGEVAQILWRLRQKMTPPTTSPPTTDPPQWGLLVYDDFSDPNSGWGTQTYQYSSVGYSGGTYRINMSTSNLETMSWWGEVFDDVGFEAAAKPSTATGSWEYGLAFRIQDMDNFYELSIMGDNTARLWKRVNGQWTQISEAVNLPPAGPDGWRYLTVDMVGNTFWAYVDDVAIGPATDNTFRQGKMGFYVGTFDTASFYTRFDDFSIWTVLIN